MKAYEFAKGQRVKIVGEDGEFTTKYNKFPIFGTVVQMTPMYHMGLPEDDPRKNLILEIERDDGNEGGGQNYGWNTVTEKDGKNLVELLTVDDYKIGQRVESTRPDEPFTGVISELNRENDSVEVMRDDDVKGGGKRGSWLSNPDWLRWVEDSEDSVTSDASEGSSETPSLEDFVVGAKVQYVGVGYDFTGTVLSIDDGIIEVKRDDGIKGSGPNQGHLIWWEELTLINTEDTDEVSRLVPGMRIRDILYGCEGVYVGVYEGNLEFVEMMRDDGGKGVGKDGAWCVAIENVEILEENSDAIKVQKIAELTGIIKAVADTKATSSTSEPQPTTSTSSRSQEEDDDPFSAYYA